MADYLSTKYLPLPVTFPLSPRVPNALLRSYVQTVQTVPPGVKPTFRGDVPGPIVSWRGQIVVLGQTMPGPNTANVKLGG